MGRLAMFGLSGEQIVIVASAILSMFSAIAVARIRQRPESEKSKVDKFGFFYDQYKILYEEAVSRVDTLQLENKELSEEIKKLEEQIDKLEEIIKVKNQKELDLSLEEREINKLQEDLLYWKQEALTGYVLLGIEPEEERK